MKPIGLDDLPQYSPWPARLLGVDGSRPIRARGAVARREFEEKYEPVAHARNAGVADEHLLTYMRKTELGDPERLVAISVGDCLHATSLWDAMERSQDYLLHYLRPEARLSRSVVDLGCGWGYLLARLQAQLNDSQIAFRGGDSSPTAVRIAQSLGLDVGEFNFLRVDYGPLAKVTVPSTVTTSFAFHQLPSAEHAVKVLASYREQIDSVINLEPQEEFFGDGLLGMLRRRYGQVCGYSADLFRVLSARRDVKIDVIMRNAIGANALLPGTLTVWRFV